jgi:hypothetical protein
MKIHYAWDLWKLQYRKQIREKILNSSESEKIEIAKELGLEDPFLLRRQVHMGFRNLVFYKILHDKKLYREILSEVVKIISENIMDKNEIDGVLAGDSPRAELKMPNYTQEERKSIETVNQMKRYLFMQDLLKKC